MSLPITISELYTGYFKTCINLAYPYVNDTDKAKDIAQESMIKAWLKEDQYNGNFSVYTWLRKIVINTAIDYKRKKHNTLNFVRQDNTSVFESFVCPCQNTDTLDLELNLNKIDLKYRFVLYYSFVKEYTQKEISEEFDIPLGTIKSSTKIGLRELRKIYC